MEFFVLFLTLHQALQSHQKKFSVSYIAMCYSLAAWSRVDSVLFRKVLHRSLPMLFSYCFLMEKEPQ